MNFYFEQLLNTALGGIDVNVTGSVIQLAGVILLLSMLFGVYEAYSNGGDVRQLALVGMKYLIVGLVFLNYQQAFRAVNAMFNSVADYMYNLNGIGDVYKSWINSASVQWNTNWLSTLFNIVVGGTGMSAILAALLTVVGYIILPITYTLFTLAYTMYGSVLYVVGPFVLALMPSRSFGRLARTYFVNLMIFQSWGLLYAILQVLMTALQMGSLQQALGSNTIFNAFVGMNPVTLMGLASLLFSISIALIPLIASRIVHGDVGSTLMDVGRGITFAAGAAATLAFTGGAALAAGRAATAEGAPPPPHGGGSKDDGGGRKDGGGGETRTASHSGSGSGGLALAEAKPPSPPVSSEAEIAGVSSSATSEGTAGAEESATSGASENGLPSLLWNPKTGQVFSWNGSGWEGAGHVSNPADSSLIQANGGSYGVTHWGGESAGQSRSGYHGHSLFGFAVWQAGTLAGRTMRAVGMGKEA
jgi:hypothetical protein